MVAEESNSRWDDSDSDESTSNSSSSDSEKEEVHCLMADDNDEVEYRLLNDIVGKSLTAKADSFDIVTTEWFDMMVAINTRIKINCAHMLFQTLATMVSSPGKQSQGCESVLYDVVWLKSGSAWCRARSIRRFRSEWEISLET
ncbi:hypothetical protein F511_10936 [Dorcoceras hygrometricum]|uniref:Uncharacterized protein n=1 Tax=Dorcoceras hygrometricum TaxID=472368 RepID=A0A2Z7AJ27_9LAMI|nr:hypothetical protein F511_10936 [Dorcoceras hygrometricum]